MLGPMTVPAWLALAGFALLVAGLAMLRRSGARSGIARRLAGARRVRVGELLDIGSGGSLPPRPVRVLGRIRCADPIVTAQDDRLVALHRDVEVLTGNGDWRPVERLRETRSFELWDHDGSLTIDPAEAAEPLVVLPHVWQGPTTELDEAFGPALTRLTTELGELRGARATTRMLSVIDRPLVLADVRRDPAGRVMLAPPSGGYVISGLDLDDAMRLLGGGRPRLLVAGTALVTVGAALVLGGAVSGLVVLAGA
jgi:hypothetical protein